MSITDTPVNQDPVAQVDAQLRNLDAQMQNLLRKESVEPSAAETKISPDGQSPNPILPPLAPPAPPRRNLARRLVRPAVGIALLVLAFSALLPLFFDLRSIQAVVNAPLITLRSPIDGMVNFRCPTVSGAKAQANKPLFEIKNTLADENRLDDLKDEQALLAARAASYRQQLRDLGVLRESLSASARKYQEARLRMLEAECAEAKARIESAKVVEKQRNAEKDQIAQLQGSHSVSNLDAGAAEFAAEAAHHGVVQAQKNAEILEEQIRSLRDGVHVGPGDGRNDLPYSAQREHELSFRIEEIKVALQQDEAKLAQLERHIRSEKKSQARRAVFESTVPNEAVVWRRYVSGDTSIKADSPLLDLIDPAEVFIDAVIYETDMSRVSIGDTARVRLAGSKKNGRRLSDRCSDAVCLGPIGCWQPRRCLRPSRKSTSF